MNRGDTWRRFVSRYRAFCYRYIGKKIEDRFRLEHLREKLKQANIALTPSLYLSTVIITGLISIMVSLIVYTIIFGIIIETQLWFIYIIILTSISSASVFLFFLLNLNLKISNRKTRIDRELPFVLSELSILASTGLSPIRIIRRMASQIKDGEMRSEFEKTIYKVDVEGKDLISALGETAKETPSRALRENLWDLSNMIYQGGNLDQYLRAKADQTLQLKRDIQREFIEKLATYSDIYLSLVVVGVLFLGIAAFLMDALGSTFAGLDADAVLLLLAYGVIPFSIFTIGIMVHITYSSAG